MTEPFRGDVVAGEYLVVLTLPPEWPPPKNGIIIEHRMPGGKIQAFVDTDGRFHLHHFKDSPEGQHIVTTSGIPVRGEPNSRHVMRLSWSPTRIAIEIDAVVVADSDDLKHLPELHKLTAHGPSGEHDDFSKKNEKAIRKRRQRYEAHTPEPGRVQGGAEHLLNSLQTETLQICDLLDHLKAGRLHHVGGLASRLRLLIGTGKPLPLLQCCAAILQVPLTVHTVSFPRERPPPIAGSIGYWSMEISHTPKGACTNPVDLDVWLQLPCGKAGAMEFSYGQLLIELGNTIGSHIDPELIPAVVLLRATDTGSGEIRFDILTKFLWKLAEEIVPLCKYILSDKESRKAKE